MPYCSLPLSPLLKRFHCCRSREHQLRAGYQSPLSFQIFWQFFKSTSSSRHPAFVLSPLCTLPFRDLLSFFALLLPPGFPFSAFLPKRKTTTPTSLTASSHLSPCCKSYDLFCRPYSHTGHTRRLHKFSLSSKLACQLTKRTAKASMGIASAMPTRDTKILSTKFYLSSAGCSIS